MDNETFRIESVDTVTGGMLLISDGCGRVRALDWADQEPRLLRRLSKQCRNFELRSRAASKESGPKRALLAYFDGQLDALAAVPVASNGTVFQGQVWGALRRIPRGRTLSYAELARQIGRPAAARAVGLANAKNPIAIIVPCHRVIGASGSLTGYSGGLERKRWLLGHESCPNR
jgi:methylated-DNA-[protein]-cysteine S-methyltransferase